MSSDSPNETYGSYSMVDNQESPLFTAKFDYQAQGKLRLVFVSMLKLITLLCAGEDELDLKVGQIVWVLSKDESISGDYGWWTGKIGDQVGIFPANYVTNEDLLLKNTQPDVIQYEELDVKEVIGAGENLRPYVVFFSSDTYVLYRWIWRSEAGLP